ncbi:MAG: fimbria/pilus periplasmic chaperone [Burkholderiaceae bacterium]
MKRHDILVGVLLGITAGIASAQSSFTVTPLRVDLSVKAPAAVVEVINTSPGPLTIQVQQRAWIQANGSDGQADVRDLIVNPSIFTMQRGEKQVVRVALRSAPDARIERAYRLLVSEVPVPQIATTPDASGFRIALRMDLPLLVAPLQAAQPNATYLYDFENSRLIVRNSGARHVRYTDAVVLQAGRKVAELPIFTVLAGGARHFDVPKERIHAGSELRLQAESNAGPVDAAVPSAR